MSRHSLDFLLVEKKQKNINVSFSFVVLQVLRHSKVAVQFSGASKTALSLKHNIMLLREITKNCSDLIPLLCSRSEKCAVTYNYREPSFEPVTAKSMQHKISFPANGTSFNNVKWDCTDFETRPGAIDRLSQWKGSHYFDWEHFSQ